jgi:murein DD-endopeptidase MepM/ murein hydrolase activator NlpD
VGTTTSKLGLFRSGLNLEAQQKLAEGAQRALAEAWSDASIKAAKRGKVVFAGFLKYFGNVVIIKHSNGFTTIYAYLRKTRVRKGSYVRQGEIIGYCYKKHSIYFEIRKRTTCLTSRKICSLILNNG